MENRHSSKWSLDGTSGVVSAVGVYSQTLMGTVVIVQKVNDKDVL